MRERTHLFVNSGQRLILPVSSRDGFFFPLSGSSEGRSFRAGNPIFVDMVRYTVDFLSWVNEYQFIMLEAGRGARLLDRI